MKRLALALVLTACGGAPAAQLDDAVRLAVRAVPVCLDATQRDADLAEECRRLLVEAAVQALVAVPDEEFWP